MTRASGNQVDVTVTECSRPRWLTSYRMFCRRLLEALDLRKTEISVLLTSDRQVRALNRRYRRLDRATDVLSFGLPAQPAAAGRTHLGDVVISLPAAARNAVRFRVGLEQEVRRLTTHGVLHLEGWDHKRAGDRRRMIARQEALLGQARREP